MNEKVNCCMNSKIDNVLEEVTVIIKIIAKDVLMKSKERKADKDMWL